MSIYLQKGQKVTLSNEDGTHLNKIIFGLSWDVIEKKDNWLDIFGGNNEIDLDASCLLFNSAGQLVDLVWFEQLHSRDGSIHHMGDNVTGDDDGKKDNEQIIVELARVPKSVKSLIFTINSFSGQKFKAVHNSFCRVMDATTQQEFAIYRLDEEEHHTAMVTLKLYRHAGLWKMQTIGNYHNGKTVQDLLPALGSYL